MMRVTMAIRPERHAFFDRLIFAILVLALPALIASGTAIFRDGDVSWHIAAGRWILEHGRVPDSDPFSFTMAGQPWVAHEWLAEIVYALAFDLAAWSGLAAVVALALIALFAIVFVHLRTRAGPVALAAALVALYAVLQPFVLARPHVLAWPFIAGWTAVLLDCRDRGRPPPLALALLMLAWANLHASYAIAFAILAAVGLDAATGSRWDRGLVKRWVLFGVASVAAALVNANGPAGIVHPLSISGMASLTAIGEWMPSSPQATPLFYPVLLGGIAAVVLKRAEFRLGELVLLLLTLGMAFGHVRHQSPFIILAVLIVTPKLAGGRRPEHGSRLGPRWLLAALVAALAVAGARAAIPLEPANDWANPRGLIAHVPEPLRQQPVFNEYDFGGPLILAGIRPYIDGRADMYGDDFFQDYRDIVRGDERKFDCAVRRHGIRWTMLRGRTGPLLRILDSSPDWRRIYSDRVGVMHVRTAGPRAANRQMDC